MFNRRNIKHIYLRFSKQVKNFLLSNKSKEFLIFLFFFFIAGSFWLLQTLNDDYETEFSIPIRLRNIPDNIVLTTNPPSQFQIRVKDKGTVLINYMLKKNFFPLNISFGDYQGVNNQVKVPSIEFEKKILSQLGASSRLQSIKPDTLEYIYSTGKSKTIPVRLKGKITSERQYYISDTIFSPDSILVYAPTKMLDTIQSAYTSVLDISDLSDTLRQTISLQPVKGAKFIPNEVEITLPVDIYTEKTVEVPITGINFPPNRTLKTFPSKVKVTFQIGLSRFNQVSSDDFVLNIPYNELTRLDADKYPVKLTVIPRNISNIRVSPEQVDFLIEQVNLNDN